MEFENQIAQLENSMKSCTSGINQAEGRISGLKDKVEELCQTSNEYRKS